MSDNSFLGDFFLFLLPLSMLVAGLIFLFTDTVHDQPGWVRIPAVLMAVLLVFAVPLSVFEGIQFLTLLCSPLLALPGLLLLYIGGKRISKQRRWGSTTARIVQSDVTHDPSTHQFVLSVTYQYTVGSQTYTDYLQQISPQEKKWVVEFMAEQYLVGKELPLSYAFAAPKRNNFADTSQKSHFPGIWLIALSLMLFYSAALGVYIWDQLSKYGFD